MGGFFAGPSAVFTVVDAEDTPLPGITVEFSGAGASESVETDAFGGLKTRIVGAGVGVQVRDADYEDFIDTIDIESGKEYTIKLNTKTPQAVLKTINFELRDEDRSLLGQAAGVSMSFSCSVPGKQPAPLNGSGPRQRVSVQTDCGSLTASISVAGFEDARQQFNVAAQDATVIVILSRGARFGTVVVSVKDAVSGSAIENAEVNLKRGVVTAFHGGLTDSTGSVILRNVPVGAYTAEAAAPESSGYSTGYSGEFSLTLEDVSSGLPVEADVLLRRADSSRLIYLKFVDSASSQPVEGVDAQLVRGSQPQITLQSDSSGLVRFINLDSNSYSVIARDENYLLRVVKDVNIVTEGSQPVVVRLVKASLVNAGTARVLVSDYSGAKIGDADTSLFSAGLGFPIASGKTGDDGAASYANLPAGEYYAEAEKVVDGALMQETSERKQVTPAAVTELPIVLVVASGTIEALVLDDSGRPLADVNVTFRAFSNGEVLGLESTASNGRTDAIEVRQDKRPYLVAQKPGFYTFTSLPYNITPNGKATATIRLEREQDPNPLAPFDVELVGVFDASGKKATQVLPNKAYTFRFNYVVLGDIATSSFVARAGLQGELNAADSNIAVRGFSSFGGDGAYSSCYNPLNAYATCGADSVDLSATGAGAKSVRKDFGALTEGVYELQANVFIRDVPASAAPSTRVQVRFGVKQSGGGNPVYKPGENELYLWDEFLSTPFCSGDGCGISLSSTIQDSGRVFYPEPAPLADGSLTTLIVGQSYSLVYSAINLGDERFDNVQLRAVKSLDPSDAFLQLSGTSFPIGTLAANQPAPATGTIGVQAKAVANRVQVDLNLGLGKPGDSMRLLFSIAGLRPMSVSLSPQSLVPNAPNTVVIKVSDSSGSPIEGALVAIYTRDSGTEVDAGFSDASGFYISRLSQPYESGKVFDVNASKAGFMESTSQLVVGTLGGGLPGLHCLKAVIGGTEYAVEDAVAEIGRRGGSVQFLLRNSGCGDDIGVKIRKHPDSDLALDVAGSPYDLSAAPSRAIANNSTLTLNVKSDRQFGIHPLYLTATQGPETFGGAVRVKVTDPAVCLFADRALAPSAPYSQDFTLDFRNAAEIMKFFNECYTGSQDNKYPENNFPWERASGTTFPFDGDAAASHSEYRIEARNTGFNADDFFLIVTEDYKRG